MVTSDRPERARQVPSVYSGIQAVSRVSRGTDGGVSRGTDGGVSRGTDGGFGCSLCQPIPPSGGRFQKICLGGIVFSGAGHVVTSDRPERARQVPSVYSGIRAVSRVSRRHPP